MCIRDSINAEYGGLDGSSMIFGLGVDIVQVSRIRGTFLRFGDRFLKRAYHEEEIKQFKQIYMSNGDHQAGIQHLASRWAVKEAAYKAFGRWRLDFREIRLGGAGPRSPPELILEGEAAERAAEVRIVRRHVSLSHDGDYAIAQVILEASSQEEVR
eukprot:TRINITY_DN47352_c0_g1_i1.p1 TRINITY_DN47352_c0_g1~~TRINITY_DN47352_c0_g1_i1.p1  ORF type:complete len:156 (-),score=44.41 TRINITY_DN47352_c0_g1_i1:276-743(-)